MYILAIETTGPYASAAIVSETGKVYGAEYSHNSLSHMKEIIPMTERLLKKSEISKEQLSLVAVSAGPGSFTGIRIGVSTARGLCQALQIKGVAVPSLEAFIRKKNQDDERTACAVINARRGQVYGIIENYLEAGPYMMTEVLDVIEENVIPDGKKVLFYGDGIDAYQNIIEERLGPVGEKYDLSAEDNRYQDAVSVGLWAAQKIREFGPDYAAGYDDILPDYMRKAEAEQKLAAGELPICKGPRQE